METIVKDLLRLIGVENLHPDDARRVSERWFGQVKGGRAMMFRLLWPWFFSRVWASIQERRKLDAIRQAKLEDHNATT